jgi:8-oxo-dGTP pyrophosphatase MutT (NUDIX family)
MQVNYKNLSEWESQNCPNGKFNLERRDSPCSFLFSQLNPCVLNRNQLLQALRQYQPVNWDEKIFIPRFMSLLVHPRAYFRDHLPGHMTGSAWIVDETRQYVLLTHHAKLNRWLQPGGHADGDEDIYATAIREAREETGINDFVILSHDLFDIDIHNIPARADFPGHDHYDIRLLVSTTRSSTLTLTDESHALEWVPVSQVQQKSGNNASMLRMAEKVRTLLTAEQKHSKGD